MRAGRRLWRTADGGLVADGDPAAVRLAYASGDELTEADEQLLAEPEHHRVDGPKSSGRPADKAGRRPADKAGG